MTKTVVALLVAGLLLSACGTMSLASATRSWVRQSQYRQNLPTLTRDVRTSASELRLATASANDLHTVCAVLYVDSEAANSSLPTPDSQATALLSLAYDDFGAGANKCFDAHSDPSARKAALTWLDKGMAALSEATVRVDVATGQSR